jgi:hypothetical protein
MAEVKCPKCACKLELGKAFVGKNPSKCWYIRPNFLQALWQLYELLGSSRTQRLVR